MSKENYKPLPSFHGSEAEYQSAVMDMAKAIFNTVGRNHVEAELKRRAPQLVQSGVNIAHVQDTLRHRF